MTTALGSLSTGGKAALALGAVGALVLAMHELSTNKAPVAVDELSTSLNTLATTGKVTGVLSTNLDEMSKSIAMMSKGASDNKFVQLTTDFGAWVGTVTGPGVSDATKNLDAWDKVMANNVKAGNPKLAAAQFEILKKAWKAGGGDMSRLGKFTNDYSNALKDQAFEQQMAAESMGIFGDAAQAAQAKLDAQKASADGLRASIVALNDVNRSRERYGDVAGGESPGRDDRVRSRRWGFPFVDDGEVVHPARRDDEARDGSVQGKQREGAGVRQHAARRAVRDQDADQS
jgi:hypothetical protein